MTKKNLQSTGWFLTYRTFRDITPQKYSSKWDKYLEGKIMIGWADGGNGGAARLVILHEEKPRDTLWLIKQELEI